MRAVSDAGYTTPTPIQAKAIPQVLSGGDLLAGAQTGTGKTAGFTLPLLHILSNTPVKYPAEKHRPRCLILTPTRELAAQVEESVKIYAEAIGLPKADKELKFRIDSLEDDMKSLRRGLGIAE